MSQAQPASSITGPFVSEIQWLDDSPDCLIVSCSDHRFERQSRQLAAHLNFKRPHVVQVPSGAVLSLPLVTAFNFLSKAVDKIIERVVEMKKVSDVILLGHQDCGAYKAERMPLVSDVVRRFAGKSIKDLQQEHLAQAAHRIRIGLRQVQVRCFFAEVVGEKERQSVRFIEIPVR